MKNGFKIALFLICLNMFCAYSQSKFEVYYKIKETIYSIDEINTQSDFQKIISELQFDYSIGEKSTVRIMRYAKEKFYPFAINTPEKRKDPKVQKIISKYTAFCIKQFKLSFFNDEYCYLLYIPKDKNLNMPDGFQAETDFFILTTNAEVSKKGESIDWKREDNLVNENFNFIKLNEIIYYYPFLNQMTVSNFYNRIDKNGNLIYNQPIGRELTGFYENIYIRSLQSNCFAMSYYDAGENIESARKTLTLMGDLLINGECNVCHYNFIKFDTPEAIHSFRLQSDQCYEKPIVLELALFENDKLDSKNNQKPGYTIMLAVKSPEIPEDSYWSALSYNTIESLKKEGHYILNNHKGNNQLVRCDFKLTSPMEVKWEVYAQNSETSFYIYDENNDKKIMIIPNWISSENNTWHFQGTMKLEKGDYRFMQPTNAVAKGYWLVCLGETDDKVRQQQIKEKQKQMDELMVWAKDVLKKQLTDIGYKDIKEQQFYSEQNVQKVRFYYPGFETQAFVVTPYYGTTVSVVDGKGNIIMEKSKMVEQKGLYFHGVFFKMLPDNEYFILIHTPSNKYDNTFLMYGLKKQ